MCWSNASNPCVFLASPDTGCKISSVQVRQSKPVPIFSISVANRQKLQEYLLEKAAALHGLRVGRLVKGTKIRIGGGRWDLRPEDNDVEGSFLP